MPNCELLAPAGNMEALKAAVISGADAVYLGGSLFNARANACNFDNEALEIAVDYCHLRRVSVFVTVNILISDREFNELDSFIRYIDSIGVDGVIVQDIGAAMYIKNIAPSLRLHASTQMTVYDLEGALFLKNLGFERVVLARELSADKIKYITQNCGIETEIFVHGAMCVCYSGQCLMSSIIGGRSGNRGKCAQPCRLQYSINNKSGNLMSLKDMCLIRHLHEIKASGVTSLKIEGRMKGPNYVGTVISIYRKYLDNNIPVSYEDYKKLESIFYRGGFSDGYYKNHKGKNMFCHTKPDNPYLEQTEKPQFNDNTKKTKLYFFLYAHIGEQLRLNAFDEFGNSAEYISENILEKAENALANENNIKEKIIKLGNTVFTANSIEFDIDENAFIPSSLINQARRDVTENIEKQIIKSHKREKSQNTYSVNLCSSINREVEICISVRDVNQLKAARAVGCNKIFAPIELAEHFNGNEIVVLPRITDKTTEKSLSELSNTDVLVRNIGQLNIVKKLNKNIHLDHTMNVFNRFSCDFYKNYGVESIILSTELTLSQIRDISGTVDCGAIIYGKLPLMITENCLIKSSDACHKGGYISDRKNKRFLVKCLPECRNEIFNSVPIMMSDKMTDIKNSGVKYGILSFIDEAYEECINIYNAYINQIPLNINFTRGKFNKGV